jgi:hypothetical protein
MSFHRNLLKVSGVVLVALAGAIAAVACGSSSSGTSPMTTIEAGSSSSGGVSSGSSSSSGGGSSSSSSSGGGDASGGEAGAPCISDAGPDAQCNSCATANGTGALSAYNTCSQFTVNCTPFNNVARGVPFTADGGLPTP